MHSTAPELRVVTPSSRCSGSLFMTGLRDSASRVAADGDMCYRFQRAGKENPSPSNQSHNSACVGLHGVQMSEIALLIFDEAHHAVKRHPYNLIMQEFYHQVRHGLMPRKANATQQKQGTDSTYAARHCFPGRTRSPDRAYLCQQPAHWFAAVRVSDLKAPRVTRPRVIGMTASPVNIRAHHAHERIRMTIYELEANLDAKARA